MKTPMVFVSHHNLRRGQGTVYFNSYVYVFVFLPVVFVVYQLLRTSRFANLWLTVASCTFYAWMTLWYLVPLFISSLLDFAVGRKLDQMGEDRQRRLLLVVSMSANLGLLAFFKYGGWLSHNMASLLALGGISMQAITPPLPPGISFYTFQTMSYTIDIYRGELKSRKSLVDYFSFVTFFPQLVAGPIERARDLLPQLEKVRPRVTASVAAGALFLILFGLFQKTVLADNFAGIVDFVAKSVETSPDGKIPPGLGLAFAYGFAFQIYCDFAAYSTIARGSARLFGIELHRNFATPYMASNPSDFWSRWHISLSQWLRDYLYIGLLGGNRGGAYKTMRNLMITMILGGLWHGAGVFFIVWGAYHGLLLVVYRLLPIDEYLVRYLGRFGRFLGAVIFFHLVCVGWIFFRATPEQFWPIVDSIVALPGALLTVLQTYESYWVMVMHGQFSPVSALLGTVKGLISYHPTALKLFWGIALYGVPVLLTDWLGYRKKCEFPDLWVSMPTAVKVTTIVALLYAILFFARREANEFIYFAF